MGLPDDDLTEEFDATELLRHAQEKSPPTGAILTCLAGPNRGRVFWLRRGLNLIGRVRSAAVQLNADGISRRHAKIVEQDGNYTLTDLGSTNGTVCRGQVVSGTLELDHGDRIVLGRNTVLRFSIIDALDVQVTAELFDQATRDPLTAAHNRRYFDDRMDSEWPWARRHERPCALLMLDIDRFKALNDAYGHAAGDAVLRELAHRLRSALRKEDLLSRIGGEEFAVLCRDTESSKGRLLAERLREAIGSRAFEWKDNRLTVTVCVGVATSLEADVTSAEELMALADRRLYQAKRAGRNRVVGPGDTPPD